MPVTQDRLTRLREFGLSEYAARSYLALLDLGIAEARDVSSISKVPQAKIYHVLEQLHEKGLVVILPEFPKKYAPVPFEEYLGRLYDEHSKAAAAIEAERELLAEMFRVMGDTDVGDRGFFTVIRGRRNVLAKIEELVGLSANDLLALGTEGGAARMAHMLPELKRARERGARVRIMSPMDASKLPILAPLEAAAEVRDRDVRVDDQSGKVAIVIADAARAFLIHFVPDDGNLHAGKDIGVFTDQEAMVAAIRAIVEPHWDRAPTLAQRRDELLHGRAPEFTRVYTSPDEAKAALASALARGVNEYAVVNGVPQHARSAAQEDHVLAMLPKDARCREVLNLADLAAVDDSAARVASTPGLEIRHLRTRVVAKKIVLDDREAFYSIATPSNNSEIVIHTNAAVVVQTLRARFERLWEAAIALPVRREELVMFPGLQPGDVGLDRLFTLLQDGLLVVGEDDEVKLWNPAAEALFGFDEAARGRPLSSLVAPESRAALEAHAKQARRLSPAGATPIELVVQREDGARIPVELTLSTLTAEGRTFLVALMRDITQRKRAQAAEVEANQRILRIYERMREAFYALDRDFRFVYRNPAVRAIQRSVSDEQIDGKVLWEAFPDLAGTRFETEFRRAMATMQPTKFQEHYPRMGMWFEVAAYPAEDGLSVYFRDITQIKLAEETARRAATLLSATLDATPDGVLVISRDGAIAGHNRKFAQMWAIPQEVLDAKDDRRVLAYVAEQLEDGPAFLRRVEELYAKPDADSHDVIRFKDGRVFERHSLPQRIGDEIVGRVWTFRDVTPAATATPRARSR